VKHEVRTSPFNAVHLQRLSHRNAQVVRRQSARNESIPGADFSALFSLSGSTYTVNELLCLYRNNADATQLKLVVGSNGTNYVNTNISGFTGIGYYSQVFLSIKTNDELDVNIYDHYGASVYSATITIDSSQFGTNYTEWSLNHKANDPTTGHPQIADKAGFWAKTLTTQERTDWVAANAAEAPVFTHLSTRCSAPWPISSERSTCTRTASATLPSATHEC
jgi:hypothetical protein